MADQPVVITVGPELETLSTSDDRLQTLVAGRYEVRRSLGRGASKEVFLARDIVSTGMSRSPSSDVRRARGACRRVYSRRSGQRRGSTSIRTSSRCYDVIEEEDATWIVSQLIRGGTVAATSSTHPQGLPIADAVRIAGEVANALHFAHENGVIHRDVKPANVLLAPPDNIALLTDFGVAFLPDQPRLTVNGTPVGTPAYMSPEQALGAAADRRSDLYSLGAMLFELVCGHPPFSANSVVELLYKQVHDPVPDPGSLNPASPARSCPTDSAASQQASRRSPAVRPRRV